MAGSYFVRIGSKQHGPFDGAQLKKLAAAGKITRDDGISKDGQKWTPAGNVQGLFPPAELIMAEKPAAIPTVARELQPAAMPQQPMAPAQPQIVYVQAPAPAAAAPQQIVQQTTVVVHNGPRGNTIAMVGAVLALLSLVFCWIPVIGMLVIPMALLSLVLAAVGLLVSLFRRGAGFVASVGGGLLAALAILVSIVSTGATVGAGISAVNAAANEAKAHAEAFAEANRERERLLDEMKSLTTAQERKNWASISAYNKISQEFQRGTEAGDIGPASEKFLSQVRGKSILDFKPAE